MIPTVHNFSHDPLLSLYHAVKALSQKPTRHVTAAFTVGSVHWERVLRSGENQEIESPEVPIFGQPPKALFSRD